MAWYGFVDEQRNSGPGLRCLLSLSLELQQIGIVNQGYRRSCDWGCPLKLLAPWRSYVACDSILFIFFLESSILAFFSQYLHPTSPFRFRDTETPFCEMPDALIRDALVEHGCYPRILIGDVRSTACSKPFFSIRAQWYFPLWCMCYLLSFRIPIILRISYILLTFFFSPKHVAVPLPN